MFTPDIGPPLDLPMLDPAYNPHVQLGAIGHPTPPPGFVGYPTYSHFSQGHADPDIPGYVPSHRRDHENDGSTSSVEADLTTLIAHAHRQHDLEKSRHGTTAALDGLSAIGSRVDHTSLGGEYRRRWADLGGLDRVPATAAGYGTGMGIGMGKAEAHANGGGPVRSDEDPWERATILSTHRGTKRSPVPVGGINIPPAPQTAPLPLSIPTFQPFSDPPKLPPITPQPYAANSQVSSSPAQPIFKPPPSTPFSAKGTVDQVTKHLEGLTTLLNPLLAQSQELEQLRQEVKMWKSEWTKADSEVQRLQGVIANRGTNIQGRFTAVLIDGDGLIFQESLMSQGFSGGLKAAQTLLSALPTLSASATINSSPTLEVRVSPSGPFITGASGSVAGENGPPSTDVGSAVVQIFINKQGLGATMVKTGLVNSYTKYEQFWQGFSASHELFTVCDVGPGKEASDAKIREHLKLYTKNAQCEMIVLGATHDNGYANILSSLQTESRLSKLLLLKGYADIAGQLKPYASRVVSIPDLFRTQKIPPVPTTFSSVVKDISHPIKESPPPSAAVVKKQSVKEDTTSESTFSEGGGKVYDWATMTSTNYHGATTVSSKAVDTSSHSGSKKSKATGGVIGASREDNGWEYTEKKKKKEKKKKRNRKLTDAVRNLNPRPCHTFYLSPWGCKNGEDCKYGHEYDLNDPQLGELARLAKSIMCPYIKDGRCRYKDEDCVYGHRCPNPETCAFGDTCRFHAIPNGHGEYDKE